MEKKRNTLQLFLPLLILAILLFVLDRTGMVAFLRGGLERIISPGAKEAHKVATLGTSEQTQFPQEKEKELEKLEKENEDLRLQLGIAKESKSQNLLMADVLSTSRAFMIDKGVDDDVQVGNSVVFKNVLIGKIVSAGKRVSRVLLPNEQDSVVAVKATKTEAKGLVKGKGGNMVLSEVTLSENLTEGDSLITVGDIDEKGLGIRPGLLVGTIENIHKSDDQLFQEATVEPLVDVKNLQNVFIVQ